MIGYRRQSGMTLVELMIALALGLIVVGAAIGLIVSIMKSNNDTIRAARLTQELRAMADIATMEIRRARSMTDPLSNVGEGLNAFTTCNAITPSADNKCLAFAHSCSPADGKGQFRTIRQDGSRLVIAAGTDATLNCASGGGTPLNSDELVLNVANFTQPATGAIRLSLEGYLVGDTSMKRTITRVVWPRSAPVVP